MQSLFLKPYSPKKANISTLLYYKNILQFFELKKSSSMRTQQCKHLTSFLSTYSGNQEVFAVFRFGHYSKRSIHISTK